MHRRTRPAALLAALAALAGAAAPAAAQEPLPAAAYVEDFDSLWHFVRGHYAYFHLKATDWDRVRELYRPRAAAVQDRREFVGLLEEVMEELYDPHAHLGVSTAGSPRLVPSSTDLWAEWREGRAVITDVRQGSNAEAVGLRPGMSIHSVGGAPVEQAARERLPAALSTPDEAARDWALRASLAGSRNAPVSLEVLDGTGLRAFRFEPGVPRPDSPLSARLLPGNLGYVRVHNSLGDMALVTAFDSALAMLRGTRGLVLDLRDTPSGGNTTVARGLMGRLVTRQQPYQRHELVGEERAYGIRRAWVEYVAPRGPFAYTAPVVVLAGRWTGSMGEGITIGLDGMGRATVIGTAMAGLLGATTGYTLPRTGFSVRLPAERLYHVQGTPRECFQPAIIIVPGGPAGSDPALAAAVERLSVP